MSFVTFNTCEVFKLLPTAIFQRWPMIRSIQEITQRLSKTSYDFPKVMKVLGIQKAKGNFAEITD